MPLQRDTLSNREPEVRLGVLVHIAFIVKNNNNNEDPLVLSKTVWDLGTAFVTMTYCI